MDRDSRIGIAVAFVSGVVSCLVIRELCSRLQWSDQPSRLRLKEDHDDFDRQKVPVPCGISGLVGNTPLFKIESLSSLTGCTILAKAEVGLL